MMLELNILNTDFEELESFNDFSSLIWDRKYYDTGNFELHCSPKYFPLFMGAEYICADGLLETGIIQVPQYDSEKHDLIVQGHFLDDLLCSRIITDIINATKTPEVFMREWISNYCMTGSRAISKMVLPALKGLGTRVPVQTRGDELPSKIREIATPQGLGFRVLYDYLSNTIRPEMWQGLDRTNTQDKNNPCVFCDEDGTAILSNYTRDATDFRNFAYVAGEGEDDARMVITVDRTNGQPRREMWVDARDLQREDGESDDSYRAKLVQRGNDKLDDARVKESAAFDVPKNESLLYKQDFDLGDLCTVMNRKLGISYSARIEEIEEAWENGSYTVTPTLGKSPSTLLGKIKAQTVDYSSIKGKPSPGKTIGIQSIGAAEITSMLNS